MMDRLYVHLVWTTRSRMPVIDRRIAEFLSEFFQVICRQERASLIELGTVRTHVHLVVRLHPTTAIPRLLQRMKGGSSVIINRSRWCHTPFQWAKGYSVHSIGQRGLSEAIEYVRNQNRHHPNEAIAGWPEPDTELKGNVAPSRFTDISRAARLRASHRAGANESGDL